MYIKLNDLIPELLDMVDANAVDSKTGIQVKAGYQLAFLSPNSQQVVVAVLADNPKILLKEAQAKTLRQAETDGRLTALDAEEALGPGPVSSCPTGRSVSVSPSRRSCCRKAQSS